MRELLASVRVRLVAATVVVLGIALAGGGWMLTRSVEGTQQARLREQIERRVDSVADRLEAGEDPATALQQVGPLGMVQLQDPETKDVLFVNAPGAGVVEHAPIPFEGALPLPGEQVEASVAEAPGIGVQLETITRTVTTPDGPITVVAAAPADEVARSVAAVRRSLLFGMPLLLVLVGLAAWVIVGRALHPVEAMRREVEAISASTLHRRVPEPQSTDEVGRLARTMNRMLGRLEDSATRQREFVSDASHELRSPVATIRTELEVALSSADAGELRSAVERALAEEGRLERLLADLLLLASTDASELPTSPVSLDEVLRSEAARQRRIPVTVKVPMPSVSVTGHRMRLERVVANLLDNAARHARSTVEVALMAGRDDVVLTVGDDGPGIPEADRERVFERFTRLDEGRARGEGGAGLGLALVETIVKRHGGSVAIGETPSGGALVEVRLPATRQAQPGRPPAGEDNPSLAVDAV